MPLDHPILFQLAKLVRQHLFRDVEELVAQFGKP